MKIFSDTFNRLRALHRARHEPENLRPLADVYWRSMLAFMLLSIVGVIAFGLWQFVVVVENLSAAQSGNSSASPVTFNRTKLEGVLRAYDARQAQYDASASGAATVADPSK
ncbi:MAG: hypothetical protein AAB480_01375 [Patescibacteria group bacterium]